MPWDRRIQAFGYPFGAATFAQLHRESSPGQIFQERRRRQRDPRSGPQIHRTRPITWTSPACDG